MKNTHTHTYEQKHSQTDEIGQGNDEKKKFTTKMITIIFIINKKKRSWYDKCIEIES